MELYRLMVRVAMSALNAGYDLTPDELIAFADDEQRGNPPTRRYTPSELGNAALRALCDAGNNVPDPAHLKKSKPTVTTAKMSRKEFINRLMGETEKTASPVPDETETTTFSPPGEEHSDFTRAETNSSYRMSRSGLFFIKRSDDGDEKFIWLAPPFNILARTLDADDRWGKLLFWQDHDGKEVKWVMPARLLGGHRDELWQALYERGLEIAPGTMERNLLLSYLTRTDATSRARVVSRTGWCPDVRAAFVLPDAVFGDAGSQIIYSGVAASNRYGVKGTLDEWRDRIGRPCIGNSRLVFAVSVAFAAPLLYVVGEESGGFHFRGGSRLGKTTAERVAGSACGGGDGENGYLTSYRATSNGLEGVCEDHCDMLLCLDEMGQIDAREAGDIIYMIANQGGKQRAARDGSARQAVAGDVPLDRRDLARR